MLNHGALAWILGNWRTSGVYTYYSGHPFQVNTGSLNASLDPFGEATATPNLIGKPKLVGDPDCWFYGSNSKLVRSRERPVRQMRMLRRRRASSAMSAATRCAVPASASSMRRY